MKLYYTVTNTCTISVEPLRFIINQHVIIGAANNLVKRVIRSDYRIQIRVIKQLYDWLDISYKSISKFLDLKTQLTLFCERFVERRLIYCMLNEADKNGISLQDKLLKEIEGNVPSIKNLEIDYSERMTEEFHGDIPDFIPEAAAYALDVISFITNQVFLRYAKEISDSLGHSTLFDLFKKVGITDKETISTVSCINITMQYINKVKPTLIRDIKKADMDFVHDISSPAESSINDQLFFPSSHEFIDYTDFWSSMMLLMSNVELLREKANMKSDEGRGVVDFAKELLTSELSIILTLDQRNIAEYLLLRNNSMFLDNLKHVLKKEPEVQFKYIKISLDNKHTKMLRVIANKYDITAKKNTSLPNSAKLVFGKELISPIGRLSEVCGLLFFCPPIAGLLIDLDASLQDNFDMYDKVADIYNYYKQDNKHGINELLQILRAKNL